MNQDFASTPEAQEYISKLQSDREKLPAEASQLEHKVLKNLKERGQALRQLTTQRSDTEKQIERLQAAVKQLGSEIDLVSGEMTGYAKLLVSVEGGRRATKAQEKAPGDEHPEKVKAEKASKGDEPAKVEPEGGNSKDASAPHGANGQAHKKPGPKPKLVATEDATSN